MIRVNAGNERWWEARKLWGAIVNHSRNLAIICGHYGPPDLEPRLRLLNWIAFWPYVMKESLRGSKNLPNLPPTSDSAREKALLYSSHMPSYVGARIAAQLHEAKARGMDGFAFLQAEQERSGLINAIGACERILKTPMPYVLAIKARRFIVLFLALLPFGLYDKVGWLTPLVSALVAYPLLSLDQIGLELQNPFSQNNLSHLPLDEICRTIEANVMGLPLGDAQGEISDTEMTTPAAGALGYEPAKAFRLLVCRQFDHPICTNLTRAFAPI